MDTSTEDGPLSQEKRQLLMLRRHWDLLEKLKEYRAQIPFFACTMLLAVTGFVLSSDRLPSSRNQAWGIVVVDLAVTAVSVWTICVIRQRYRFVNTRIDHLYEQLGIKGDKFFPDPQSKDQDASVLFTAAITAVVVVGLICALGVGFAPVLSSSVV